jgi:hypothetical protein
VYNGDEARCFGQGESVNALDPRVAASTMMEKSTKTWLVADLHNLPGDYPSIAGNWVENSKKKIQKLCVLYFDLVLLAIAVKDLREISFAWSGVKFEIRILQTDYTAEILIAVGEHAFVFPMEEVHILKNKNK